MAVPERWLSDDEVTAVLRRAAELDHVAGREHPALDQVAVERAAVEAGLSLESVRSALAELHTGRLQVGRPRRRWSFPAPTVTVERDLPVTTAAATDRLAAFLRSQTMRTVRRRDGITVWEPSRALAAKVARGVDVGGRVHLKPVGRVTVSVEGSGATCRARVELDVARARHDKLRSAIAGSTLGGLVAGSGVAAAVVASELALLAVPVGTGGAAAAWLRARSDYEQRIEKATTAVELVLDELEADPPHPGARRSSSSAGSRARA